MHVGYPVLQLPGTGVVCEVRLRQPPELQAAVRRPCCEPGFLAAWDGSHSHRCGLWRARGKGWRWCRTTNLGQVPAGAAGIRGGARHAI